MVGTSRFSNFFESSTTVLGILTRFSIHESILLVIKSIHLSESLILDSPENAENRDFETILDSLNRDVPS